MTTVDTVTATSPQAALVAEAPELVPLSAERERPQEPAPVVAPDPRPALEEALDALGGRLAATDRQISDGMARMDAVEAAARRTAGGVSDAGDRLSRVDGAVVQARTEIDSIADRLESVDGRVGAFDSRMNALADQLAALQRETADRDRALADVRRTISAEVERQTSDAQVTAQHSLQLAVNSIAQLALAMGESSRDLTEDLSAESATALLDSFRVDLDAILAQLGFEPLGTGVGATFDPHRHRALTRMPTSDPAQDKSITRVIRDGYRSASTGRILLFADVEVGRLRP